MKYESLVEVRSHVAPDVSYTIARMSFGRRVELMRRIRELAGRIEFLEAGCEPKDKMDARLLRAEIDRLYLTWGLQEISGLQVDGRPATAESLADCGPEDLCREALAAVRKETALDDAEIKN
jgi:hypothetical protein